MKTYLLIIAGDYCSYPEDDRSFERPYRAFENLEEAISAAEKYVREKTEKEPFPGRDSFGHLDSYYYSFRGIVYEMTENDNPIIVYRVASEINFGINDMKTFNISRLNERVEVEME